MDCLTFRRKLLEDPMRNERDLLQHEDDCSSCAEFARQTRRQDAQLRAALNQIKPPPELADQIRLATSFEPPLRQPSRRWLAIAASLLLVAATVTVSLLVTPLERQTLSVVNATLDHMHDEIRHMHETNDVDSTQLEQLFNRFGAEVTGDFGTVDFAAECDMRKKTGVHLVMAGQQGPITVFFMPQETVAEYQEFNDAVFHGRLTPTEWGSLAVIGTKNEPLDGVEKQMLRAVRWPPDVKNLQIGGYQHAAPAPGLASI